MSDETRVVLHFKRSEDAEAFVKTARWIGLQTSTGRLWSDAFRIESEPDEAAWLTQDQLDRMPTIDVRGIDTLYVGPPPEETP